MSSDDLTVISSIVFFLIGVHQVYIAVQRHNKEAEELDRRINDLQKKIWELERQEKNR
jgi:hypothetical protein